MDLQLVRGHTAVQVFVVCPDSIIIDALSISVRIVSKEPIYLVLIKLIMAF
ncbi:MAG: hypothetical protein AAF830_11745 [Pseudomonadota bacterium]